MRIFERLSKLRHSFQVRGLENASPVEIERFFQEQLAEEEVQRLRRANHELRAQIADLRRRLGAIERWADCIKTKAGGAVGRNEIQWGSNDPTLARPL